MMNDAIIVITNKVNKTHKYLKSESGVFKRYLRRFFIDVIF